MTEQDGQAAGLDRAKRWLANARVTASVAAHVVSPLAGPVADRFDNGPARTAADLTHQVQGNAQRDWAEQKLVRRERSGSVVPPSRFDTSRHPKRQR